MKGGGAGPDKKGCLRGRSQAQRSAAAGPSPVAWHCFAELVQLVWVLTWTWDSSVLLRPRSLAQGAWFLSGRSRFPQATCGSDSFQLHRPCSQGPLPVPAPPHPPGTHTWAHACWMHGCDFQAAGCSWPHPLLPMHSSGWVLEPPLCSTMKV